MTSIPEYIAHYQRSIEKSENDRKRLLHCIGKLYKLPITVQHLQETGIGRTVNALRKDDGEVGVAAKALVTKWKAMVAAEETSDDDDVEEEEEEDEENDDTHHDDDTDSRKKPTTKYSDHCSNGKVDRSHKSSTTKTTINSHHTNSEASDHHSVMERSQFSDKEKLQKSSHHKTNHTNNIRLHSDSKEDELDDDDEEENRLIIDISNKEKNDGEMKREPDGRSKNSHSKNGESGSSKRSDEYHKHSSSNSSGSKSKGKDNRHNNSKNDSVREDFNAHRSSTSSRQEQKIEKNNDKSHRDERKSSSLVSNKDHYHHHPAESSSSNSNKSHKSSKESRDRDHHSNSVESPSTSSKHYSKDRKKMDTCDSNSKDNEKKLKRKSESSRRSSGDSGGDVVVVSSSSSKSKKAKIQRLDEIDSSMGTSFADALGMMEPPPIPSSSSTKITKSTKSQKCATSTPVKKLENKVNSLNTPTLLSPTIKLEPLESELAVDLPQISNNYKPMPLNPLIMDCVFNNNKNNQPIKKMMTDEEALGASFASKNLRTKVYSGNKSTAPMIIPTLHELCTRVLQKNIDALEYTGGVPFEILKPILERATPTQLLTFEHHNPYLVEDSDILWKEHCKRIFRSQKPREFESCREMFLRCRDEQEARLNKFAVNMKKSQSVAIPVKKTKLAYVDSMVKPPRNVIKKQNQFGTERKLVATPAARVESLKNACSNIAPVGDTRLKVLASIRDTAQATAIPIRPKKAPLMMKSLQLLKGRFKR